ncbi:hypothetical protein QL285_057845 [Trifolium repens]|nr:hypothetical protein QL285_057845 [Trifolium repens]
MGEGRKKITVAEYTGGRRATQVGRSSTINPKVKVGVAPSMVAEKVKVGITPSMVSEKVKVLKTILFILSNLFNSIVSFTGWESIAGNRYTTDDCQNINNNEANLKEVACSHEGGTTSNTVGVTLCRSKRKNSSPMKDHKPTEITKRRRNIWNESEVDTLRSGVLKYVHILTNGVTIIFCSFRLYLAENGKKILHFYGFEKRTAVDLKDKWTNILKSEAKQTTANETFANRCFFSAD